MTKPNTLVPRDQIKCLPCFVLACILMLLSAGLVIMVIAQIVGETVEHFTP